MHVRPYRRKHKRPLIVKLVNPRSLYDLRSRYVSAPVRPQLVRWDHKRPNGARSTAGNGDMSEASFILWINSNFDFRPESKAHLSTNSTLFDLTTRMFERSLSVNNSSCRPENKFKVFRLGYFDPSNKPFSTRWVRSDSYYPNISWVTYPNKNLLLTTWGISTAEQYRWDITTHTWNFSSNSVFSITVKVHPLFLGVFVRIYFKYLEYEQKSVDNLLNIAKLCYCIIWKRRCNLAIMNLSAGVTNYQLQLNLFSKSKN